VEIHLSVPTLISRLSNPPALELLEGQHGSGSCTLLPWGTLSWLMATTMALHSFQSITAQLCSAGHLTPPHSAAHRLSLSPFFPHLGLALLSETKSLWFHYHRNQSREEK